MSNHSQRSDPEGLRAGVERLIAEWEQTAVSLAQQRGSLTSYDARTIITALSDLANRAAAELRSLLVEPSDSEILTAGDSDNPIRALNTHGQTGSEANSADTLGPANRKAVAKNVGAIRQESDRPAVRTTQPLLAKHPPSPVEQEKP